MSKLIQRLETAFNLTENLASLLSSNELTLTLGELPSNTMGEQLWCMVGARESYLKAIVHQEWSGFSCSLNDVASPLHVQSSLKDSSEKCLAYLSDNDLTDEQKDFVFLLLEHEVQHHGQLIRYIYGNSLSFPESWKNRYNV